MTSPVWDEKGRTHNTGGSTRSGWSNPRIRAASPYPTHVVCRHVQTRRSAPRPVREPGPTQPRHPKPHGKTAEDAVLQEANGPASAGWWKRPRGSRPDFAQTTFTDTFPEGELFHSPGLPCERLPGAPTHKVPKSCRASLDLFPHETPLASHP